MFWPMIAIALGFPGSAVIGILAVRVFVEAERLGRQVGDFRGGSAGRRRIWSGRRGGRRSGKAL